MADFSPWKSAARDTIVALRPLATHSRSDCFGDNTAVEFLEGVLPAPDAALVEDHAAQCDECRRLLAALGGSPSLEAEAPTVPAGTEAHMALARGQKVGRFMVLSRIGAGGMGVVFAAYDPKLDRKVALKLLRSAGDGATSTAASQMRLLREAQAMAQLSHPHVIAVYDVGTYQSEVYIAMEFVEGETLTSWLRRWDRPWREILGKFLDAGSALAKAHGGGLAHRDFKPDNVLVGHDERVRVMDFGLARSLLFDAASGPASPALLDRLSGSARNTTMPGVAANILDHPLTKTGALVGTPRYMAPEQLAGQETDARSDQFSFCVALYEALYRQHPFEDETAQCLVKDAAARPRTPPASSKAPAWLHRALLRGLSTGTKDRFPSMDALLRALTPPMSRQSQTRFVVALAVAALAIITAAYAVPALIGARDDNQKLSGDLHMAHGRIERLQRQINTLIGQIEELEDRSHQQRLALHELTQKLNNALDQLEQAERELSVLAETPLAPSPQRSPRPAAQAPEGLSGSMVITPLQPIPHELATCFREWVEREPSDRLLFAVRLTIDPRGVPALGSRSGGIDDRVLHECVTFNLEKLRFPRANATSVVHYKFYRTPQGKLGVSADVVDIIRGPGRGRAG